MSDKYEPFLTVKQLVAKKVLPIGKSVLYELLKDGIIPHYKMRGKTLLLESEVYQAVKNKFHLRGVR